MWLDGPVEASLDHSVPQIARPRPGWPGTPVVEVSYDDGVTWQPTKVGRDRGRWQATVVHPAGAAFVSLRSTVSDSAGNTQHQTITRASALT